MVLVIVLGVATEVLLELFFVVVPLLGLFFEGRSGSSSEYTISSSRKIECLWFSATADCSSEKKKGSLKEDPNENDVEEHYKEEDVS